MGRPRHDALDPYLARILNVVTWQQETAPAHYAVLPSLLWCYETLRRYHFDVAVRPPISAFRDIGLMNAAHKAGQQPIALVIGVVLPERRDEELPGLKLAEHYHRQFRSQKQWPNWRGQPVDFQFWDQGDIPMDTLCSVDWLPAYYRFNPEGRLEPVRLQLEDHRRIVEQ